MDRQVPSLGRWQDASRGAATSAILFRCDVANAMDQELAEPRIVASLPVISAIAASRDAVVVGISPEGTVLVWNSSAESLFRLDARDAIGRPIATLFPTGATTNLGEILLMLLQSCGARQFDRHNVDRRDIALATVSTAVEGESGRVRSKGAPQEGLRELRAILATAADAIITIDARGIVRSFNPAAERMFGFAAAEIIGANIARLMPAPYCDEHDLYLARYHESRIPKVIGSVRELVARRKNGERFPIELAVSEVEAGRRYTGIVRDISERKALQGQLLTIVEQEKRRIGQDLHDDIGQELTGLGLTAETLFEALEDYSLPEADLAARLSKGVRRTLQKVRRVSRGLMPVEVEAGGLTAALIELTVQLEHADDIRCAFDYRQPVTVSDSQVATQLYRIAQEATANAVRHARARRIEVSLDSQDGIVTLEIRDDGIGIDVSARRHGNGLQIMQHRAGLIGATLSVGPGAGNGTHVSCRVPEGGRFGGREP